MERLHCTFDSALRILREEQIELHVHPTGHVRYEINKDEVPRLLQKHTSAEARHLRIARGASRNGQPLSTTCPKCGQLGRQHRHIPSPEGMEMAICGVCRKRYWTGVLINGVKVTCPHCNADAGHIRSWAAYGLMHFDCRKCETYFTVVRIRPGFGDLGSSQTPKLEIFTLETKGQPEEQPDGIEQPAEPQQPLTKSTPHPNNSATHLHNVEPGRAAHGSPDREVWDSPPAHAFASCQSQSNILESPYPLSWFYSNWPSYMTLRMFKTELQMENSTALNLLKKEGIQVYRLPVSEHRVRYFIPREPAERVLCEHATPQAIADRKARYRANRHPINALCPLCGEFCRHWRAGSNSNGSQVLECSRCRKRHTVDSSPRPPLKSTCVHCKATTRQQRRFVTMLGMLGVKCAHCGKVYSIPWQPDPDRQEESHAIQRRLDERTIPMDSECPFCSANTRQWRRHIQLSGELRILCGQCRRHYTLVHKPTILPSLATTHPTWPHHPENW